MLTTLNAVVIAVVFVGIIVLSVSLYQGHNTYRRASEHFQAWWILLVLHGLFIVGYLAFVISIVQKKPDASDFIVVGLLVGGSYFVWIVNKLGQSVITELTRVAALERHRAIHDDLTNLPNRAFFTQYLDQQIRRHKVSQPQQLAVLMMDMDRFKMINDTMGHYYGDILLQEIALRLHRAIRKTDMLARLGGDEFGVLLDLSEGPRHLEKICQHIVEALEQPFAVGGRAADVGISIGVAWCPDHGISSTKLMKHAKSAMYEAKKTTIDTVVYHQGLDSHDLDRLHILNELCDAIDHDGLVVHFQPQVDLKKGVICSAEALIRWPHPRFGLLSPDEFIPMAEQNGLINRLSYWVLDIVMDQLKRWQKSGIHLPLSTNISATDLQDNKFVDYVMEGLSARSLQKPKLTLEITESAVISRHVEVQNVIKRLQKLGLKFAIDDFGTGYSSLQYIKKLPVEEIKIDKSFVLNMTKDNNDAMIIRSTIDLAHKLGRKVTAEGVESSEVLQLLSSWSCDRAQGFYLAQPLPIEDLNQALHENRSFITPVGAK